MLSLTEPIDHIIVQISELDRDHCIDELRHVPHLKLDFTEEYLRKQSVESLRHLLLAAVQQARRHLKRSA